ncbi:probable G-protein coupled receptor AH9.1 [Macrobrachium nipponense]|uniref:probable G-protein coupled receptor AH9.1 n=1 Tax=Macrobrachium nipponense TaxID=159736 RepID=UPI0030C83E81
MTNTSVDGAPNGAQMQVEYIGYAQDGVIEHGVEDTMSPEIEYMGHIAYSVVAPVIISFGILSNTVNLVVLTRPSLRGPTFRYLKWLAVDNLLVCVVLLPFTLHSHVTPVPYPAALYFAHIEVPVGNALIASSVYIVVGLSFDRFVAVCYPRKYRNLHSHYVASVRIALSFIIAFIIYIPMAFYKIVVPLQDSPDRYLIEENLDLVSQRWFTVYEYLLEICVRFAPAVMLAVLNTYIIIEFKKISRRRRLLSQNMSCEVSAIPSQSYGELNAPNTVIVNSSPPTNVQPDVVSTCVTTEGTLNAASNLAPSPKETGHLDDGNQGSSIQNSSNGELVCTRNSSSRSLGKIGSDKEKIGLSMINVEGPPIQNPQPRGMSERRHDMERRLVLLLVSIIVAFFVTNIPAAVLSLTFRDEKRSSLNYQIFRAVANNLEFLNFGLNFILYFLFSKDIRNAFTSLLRRTLDRVKERLEGSSSKYAATNL